MRSAARRLLAAAPSSGSAASSAPSAAGAAAPAPSAWDSLKKKFKSKFMIGDTHEHYIPPRVGFQRNHPSAYDLDAAAYRDPSPGSQPVPNIPRGYPETEYDISLAKRPSLKLTPAAGAAVPKSWAEHEAIPSVSSTGMRWLPRHIPQPSWVYDRESLKRMRRLQLETGYAQIGCPNFASAKVYHPVQKHQTREEWEKVEVIRDIRIPRL